MIIPSVLLLISLSGAQAATGGQFCGTNLCVNAVVNGESVTYQLVSSLGYADLGWMAVGFGSQMPNSPMVITWPNSDGTVTISQREATAHVMPTVVADPTDKATFVTENSLLATNGTTIAFTYPLPSTSLDAVPMIWSYSTNKPSSSAVDARLVQHDKMGTATMDLTQTVNSFSTYTGATTTVVGSGTETILPLPTGSSSTGSSGQSQVAAPLTDSERRMKTHGILMSVGFLVCLPLGIFIARFSRTISSLKTKWFTAHWFIQAVVSGPIILAGWIIAYDFVGSDHFRDSHTKAGLALLILYILQMTLGIIIHFFKPRRDSLPPLDNSSGAHIRDTSSPSYNAKESTSNERMTPAITARPPQNYLHAILGLSIIALGMYNVHEGYNYEWPTTFGDAAASFIRSVKAWWIASVVIIPIIYVAGLLLLPRQWRHETSARRRSA